MIRIALDAMGGDNAPSEIVLGAVDAVKTFSEVEITLLGSSQAKAMIPQGTNRVKFIETSEVISTAETPTVAIRTKKDSSLVRAFNLLKEGSVDAVISAGNTGAVLAGGQFLAGRIKGVKRSPLAPLIPTKNGKTLLIDCGANVDARAEHLLQFAMMGTVYMEKICGIKNPKVAIVNIGAEEEKGNALVKEAFPLLKECESINFIGNIEARDIPEGLADVVVCEAFVGNVILKLYEGVANSLLGTIKEVMMSSFTTKIGALLIKGPLKERLKSLMASEQGGAPLLGLNGLVVKAHGNSTRKEIMYAVKDCVDFIHEDVTGSMRELFERQ